MTDSTYFDYDPDDSPVWLTHGPATHDLSQPHALPFLPLLNSSSTVKDLTKIEQLESRITPSSDAGFLE